MHKNSIYICIYVHIIYIYIYIYLSNYRIGGQVVVGKSWGKLVKKQEHRRFDSNNCNAVQFNKVILINRYILYDII